MAELESDPSLDFHNGNIATVASGEKCPNKSQTYVLTSPLGHVYTNACQNGLHCVKLYGDADYDNINWKTKVGFYRRANLAMPNKQVTKLVQWLTQYFKDPLGCAKMPIEFCCLEEYGEFNSKVWMTIHDKCPPGELMSYVELAVESGYGPGASKVVGYAINKNPFMLVVGDHRIVTAAGKIWCLSLDQQLEKVKDRNDKSKGTRKRNTTKKASTNAKKRAKRVKKEESEEDEPEEEEQAETEPEENSEEQEDDELDRKPKTSRGRKRKIKKERR